VRINVSMTKSLTIVIVDKSATLKPLTIKDYKVEELYKKCGFKKAEGFELQTEWSVKIDGQKYVVQMYGKLEGKANMENKYDFPPPIDSKLYFGSCALVALTRDDSNTKYHTNLSIALWDKIYEKLFGGFESLALTEKEDEHDVDELAKVPKNKLTKKGGYLKDGFVVDSSETEEYSGSGSGSEDEDEADTEETSDKDDTLLDVGSELSEEPYV
jgi:hypothetical protein